MPILTEQQVRQIAQEVIFQNNSNSQFAVTQVPYHTHNRTDSSAVSYPNLANRSRFIVCRILGSATTNTVANTVGGNFVMPFAGNFVAVTAYVDTAGTTGPQTTTVSLNGVAILNSTLVLNILSTKTESNTVSYFAVTSFNAGDVLTFNVTAIQSTAALGLTVQLRVTETSP